MKNNLSLLIGATLLATLAGSFAQTAVTDPVGYITVNVSGTASLNTYSAITPTLVNKVEYSGVVSAISGDGLTLTVSGLTSAAYGPNFWLEVTNGTGEGMWTNVVSNTGTQIVVQDSLTTSIAVGTSTIKIRQHVTVGQFFGAANTAGLKPGGDTGAADEVIFLGDRGELAQNVTVFFDGTTWNDQDFNPATDKIIEPGQGLLVTHKTASNVSFVQVGHVKTGKSMTSILAGPTAANFGENLIGVRSAVGMTLGNSKLVTSGLASGGDSGAADEIVQFVGGALKYYFHDGSTYVDGDFTDATNVPVAEGSALYVIRKTGGDFAWITDAVTIAP